MQYRETPISIEISNEDEKPPPQADNIQVSSGIRVRFGDCEQLSIGLRSRWERILALDSSRCILPKRYKARFIHD